MKSKMVKCLSVLVVVMWWSQVGATVIQIPFPQRSYSSSTSVKSSDTDQWVEDHLSSHPASEHVDLVVVFTDQSGNAILPDAAKSNQSSMFQDATNELTFTYNSPEFPFTQEELDLLQPAVAVFNAAIRDIYGSPAFNLTVNVRKNPNISSAGLYYSYNNEIVVPFVYENTLDVICHEIVHAYHDDYIINFDSFEEGFARSVEVILLSRMSEYDHSWDSNFSYSYDVWYEGENNPGIGGVDGSFYYGNTAITLLRYQMSGYAWAKVFYENESFYRNFNSSYYSKIRSGNYIASNEEELKNIIRSIVPSVEGQQFDDWYANQHILDSNPPVGYQIVSRIGQYTFDYFHRDEYGYESAQSGETIFVDFFNSNDELVDSGFGITSSKGWADIYPVIKEEGFGRLTTVAEVYSPDGLITQTFYKTPSKSNGIFGAVINSESGEVTITSPISVVTVPVEKGVFYAPEFKEVEGRFTATFQSDNGYTASKGFNKGASDYFVLINDEIPVVPPVMPPVVEPVEPPVVEPVEPKPPVVVEPIDGNPKIPEPTPAPVSSSSGGGGGGCFIMSTW